MKGREKCSKCAQNIRDLFFITRESIRSLLCEKDNLHGTKMCEHLRILDRYFFSFLIQLFDNFDARFFRHNDASFFYLTLLFKSMLVRKGFISN